MRSENTKSIRWATLFFGLLSASACGAADYEIRYFAPSSGAEKTAYSSCKSILSSDPDATSGVYTLQMGEKKVDVQCDMTKDGGGWTAITPALIDEHLQTIFKVNQGTAQFENGLILFSDGTAPDDTDVRADIKLPFSYESFYIDDLAWRDKPNGDTWDQGHDWSTISYEEPFIPSDPYEGDTTIGSADFEAPVFSYYAAQGKISEDGAVNTISDTGIYSNPGSSQTLSIRAHEYGNQAEEMYPFYSGKIWVR